MGMEDIMKALMQSAGQAQGAPQQSAGGDLLSGVLGSLMGGGQQATSQQSGGADLLSGVLGGLMGGGQQQAMPQQQMMPQQQAGGEMMGMLGSLLGGGQQPMQQQPMQQQQSGGDMMLGMLEQIIGGQPGQGQQLGISQMGAMGGMNNPMMGLLQPIVNQVAGKLGISPQIATVVASIAMHYLLSSHPSTSPQAPMNLGSVMQQLGRSGTLSQGILRNSGMVNDVMQATGMNKQDAVRSLDATFGVLGSQVQGMAG